MIMRCKSILCVLFGVALLAGCTAAVPEHYSEAEVLPIIYPAYRDITIP